MLVVTQPGGSQLADWVVFCCVDWNQAEFFGGCHKAQSPASGFRQIARQICGRIVEASIKMMAW